MQFSFKDLDACLRYEPETGKLFWKYRTIETFFNDISEGACKIWNTRWAGKEAFTALTEQGAKRGTFCKVPLKAHRVCWLLHYGKWPDFEIDHINGDPSDNRIENLRDIKHSRNQKNLKCRDPSKGARSGVTFDKARNKWMAQMTVNGKTHNLGRFETLEEANEVRASAQVKHGFTDRHGAF